MNINIKYFPKNLYYGIAKYLKVSDAFTLCKLDTKFKNLWDDDYFWKLVLEKNDMVRQTKPKLLDWLNWYRFVSNMDNVNIMLISGAKYGYLKLVKWAVNHGASINLYDTYPLKQAIINLNLDIVTYLLNNKAIINYSAIEIAVATRNLNIIHSLLYNQGAKNNALLYAVEYEYLDVVEYLVKQGATLNKVPSEKFSKKTQLC